MLLHTLVHVVILSVRLRGDNAVCVSAEQLLKIVHVLLRVRCRWPALRIVVQAS